MSYPTNAKAMVCYIEANVTGDKFNYEDLERRIGFSQAHLRDLFRKSTGIPLAQYVRMRKIKNSALELLYTDKTILDISYKYGFSNPETYTRAFSKIVGMTPSEFRKLRPLVGKEELVTGVYGIGLLTHKEQRSDINMNQEIYRDNDSTILYGVPKVAHGTFGGCTPYPICLKAISEYLGEDLEYYDTMVASAAAFRFIWNNEMWDMSNVDIYHTLEESEYIYHVGPQALGREFEFLCMGALSHEKYSVRKILANAVKALEGRIDCGYSKGILAYDAWKRALETEKDFAVDGNYSLLFEKALCQNDAFGCLIDGRKAASAYFAELAENSPENAEVYQKITDDFIKCLETVREIRSLYNSPNGFDGFMEKLADAEVRRKTCELIEVAKRADCDALELMKKISL